ncbi:unnamed protein product [Bursaphelenchus xylophilus]|uniref:(pine wood nematode) hypothetical protein n=1 Tax=Bursaphelenchus xylophilus TaxID=6326 RepID=A0A1I7RU26_BURXY|nr:unnamed protein product [Bursaphelenchus xylophilus]CAG9132003.1 unnamed protein product [Bursaphelenchus xylophilus]
MSSTSLEVHPQLFFCRILYGTALTAGMASIFLLLDWLSLDGPLFDGVYFPERRMKLHVMAMCSFLVVNNGLAICMYRAYRGTKKLYTKGIHSLMHFINVIFIIFGLKAAFDAHNYHKTADGAPAPRPNLHSSHSWIGLATCILYTIQYLSGLVIYGLHFTSPADRKRNMPMHRAFGLVLFGMAFAVTMMGITQYSIWHTTCPDWYCMDRIVVNALSLSLTIFFLCVVIIVHRPEWRRLPLPEEVEKPLESASLTSVDTSVKSKRILDSGSISHSEFDR